MRIKRMNRLCGIVSAIAVLLSCMAGITGTIAVSAAENDGIITLAEQYVAANRNGVSAEGLLNAVKAEYPSVTLNENDFYIKHAVNGVKDDTSDYPLDIQGSDGAVAAVFVNGGSRIGFSKAFGHETEVIHINETAIVGTSTGFSYDGEGNVTAYTGTADKIVFPDGYNGTMKNLEDKTSVNNVKVLIYNGNSGFLSSGFSDWNGLIAVQMGDQTNSKWGFMLTPARNTGIFSNCGNLKYFKFSSWIHSGSYWNAIFPSTFFEGCSRLETVILPNRYNGLGQLSENEVNYGDKSFYGTAVREFVFLQDIGVNGVNQPRSDYQTVTFGNPSFTEGTRNIHFYAENMTFIRAAALAAAGINALDASAGENEMKAAALAAVKGSADAAGFAAGLTYGYSEESTDIATEKILTVSNGTDSVPLKIFGINTLADLQVSGATLQPSFDPFIKEYSINVSFKTTSLPIMAVPVSGATVQSITGNTELKTGNNKVLISVLTSAGKTVTYTVKVYRQEINLEDAFSAARLYVNTKRNASTADGLLNAVKEILPDITLKDEDFYVKHAVNGVRDDSADYPLNIKGSDGAVAAVFELNGKQYGFSAGFPHETEAISIKSTAVVGKSAGFSYDASGNVTAYNGNADKLVFPEDYTGTMTNLSDKSSVNKVKVLIYNGKSGFIDSSFNDWDGLIAVQMGNQTNSAYGFSLTAARNTYTFANCDNLKYFKFPSWITSGSYWNSVFPTGFLSFCPKLETVVLPNKYNGLGQLSNGAVEYGDRAFYGTAIREFTVTQSIEVNGVWMPREDYLSSTFGKPTYGAGTRNIHFYQEKMTLVRAAALAAAELYNADVSGKKDMQNIAQSAVKGSADAAGFADSFTYSFSENENKYEKRMELTAIRGGISIPLYRVISKTLSDLSVKGKQITPYFDSSVCEYSLSVPNKTTSLTVNAVPVKNARVISVSGADSLSVGENRIVVTVENTKKEKVGYIITVTREEPMDSVYSAIISAAKNYVGNQGYSVTAEGLLTAVKQAVPTVLLDAENDFYIRHAVNGVRDNTEDYPLNITGHDGAVAAVFENDGKRYGVTVPIAHRTENIHISKTAVVGKSEGFTYDGDGNVTGYNGNADKLVFPENYSGSMSELSDKTHVNNIKVLIYNGKSGLLPGGFSKWEGLVAVQMGNQINSNYGFLLTQGRAASTFADCGNLKYFKFPAWINSGNYWNAVFPTAFLSNCTRLETVVLPTKYNGLGQLSNGAVGYGEKSFYGTAVREFVITQTIAVDGISTPNANYLTNTFGGSSFKNGAANIHFNKDKMTLARAAALAAAAVNELDASASSAAAVNAALAAIKGSEDAAVFTKTLTCGVEEEWEDTDIAKTGVLRISNGTDSFPLYFNASKALRQLDVGFDLTPAFAPDVTDYELSVANSVTKLQISTVLAEGATLVSINGNENFVENTPKLISIAVKTAGGVTVVYKINVTRRPITPIDDALENRIRNYAGLFSGDNYTDTADYSLYLSGYSLDPDLTFKVKDFYKYNSIPGAKEGTEVLVPGRDGYISSVIEVSNGEASKQITVTSPIKPYMKSYTFAPGEVSNPKDFSISDDGTTLEYYSGNAKKIVMPEGISYIDSGWYNGEHPGDVQVLIVPDSVVELPASLCYGMTHLEACYLGNGITEIPSSVFSRCYYLQFLHTPEQLEGIGYGAFMFAMTLPEIYLPPTMQSIAVKAFWSSGVRNFNLPVGMTSVSDASICYPGFKAGIWNEPDAQTPEMVKELTEIMNGYQFYNNNLVLTYFGSSLNVESPGSIGGTSQQVLGAIVEVRAPEALENTVFKGKQQKWTHYHFNLDMSISEIVARAQFAAQNNVLYDDASASDAETVIKNAFYSSEDVTLSWKTPFSVNNGKITGVATLTRNGISGDVVVDRDAYTPPPVPKNSTLKGDPTSSRLELIDNEDSKSDSEEETPDTQPTVDFDDLDDEEETVIPAEKGPVKVKLQIHKLGKNKLSKTLRDKLDGFAYVAFSLSISSDETVRMNGKIGVSVPLPKGFDAAKCHIYYVGENGRLIDMKAKKYGDNLGFYTSEMATYILVQDVTDNSFIIISVIVASAGVLLISGGVTALLLIKRKKRKA